MSSNSPQDPISLLADQIKKLFIRIIDAFRNHEWDVLLLLLDATLIFLFVPKMGLAHDLLPRQYPFFFWITVSLLSSVAFILIILRYIRVPRPSKKFVVFTACMVAAIALVFLIQIISSQLQPRDTQYVVKDKFSEGEELLISGNLSCRRSTGEIAYQKSNYKLAEDYYKEYLKNCRNEPEVKIYLENARAVQAKSPIKIAVSVPVSRMDGDKDSKEILRGVALAQNEWNTNKRNKKLLVVIANDGYRSPSIEKSNCGENRNEGECKTAQEVANALVKQKDILGVIGHFSSDATDAAAKEYNSDATDVAAKEYNAKLVAISPTSTAIRLNFEPCSRNDKICLNPYIFRTAFNDSKVITELIGEMPQQIKKVAIVYEGDSTYSRLFKKTFTKRFIDEQGPDAIINPQDDLENTCNFSKSRDFDATACLKAARRGGANALLLIPTTKMQHLHQIMIKVL